MSNQLSLTSRSVQGKKLKALRAAGQIPSVIYGDETPLLAASDYNATEKVLLAAGYHSPIELMLDGQPHLAIVKNISLDPVSRRIMNVEFQAVSADEVVEAINSGERRAIRKRMLGDIEEICVECAPSCGAIQASKLSRSVQELEKSASLMELNMADVPALEQFMLNSLRIWMRQ